MAYDGLTLGIADTTVFSSQLLAVIGDQLQAGDELCGIVLSIRYQEDILSLWNRDANNRSGCEKIQCVNCVPCCCL
jgi:hypothetical protein